MRGDARRPRTLVAHPPPKGAASPLSEAGPPSPPRASPDPTREVGSSALLQVRQAPIRLSVREQRERPPVVSAQNETLLLLPSLEKRARGAEPVEERVSQA